MSPLSPSLPRKFAIAALATVGLATGAGAQGLSAGQPISFKMEVLPIFQHACIQCHQPGGIGYERSGLDLRSYAGVMKGTKYGAVVLPGEPFTSNLMVLLEGRAAKSIQRPLHRNPLRPAYINIIRQWIQEGAKDN